MLNFSFDISEISEALKKKSEVKYDAVVLANITEIYNRGKAGGTPVKTGELRISLMLDPSKQEAGYTKEYAPHVEYGHRTRGGGYVQGQYFLLRNVDTQRPRFEQDILKALEEE